MSGDGCWTKVRPYQVQDSFADPRSEIKLIHKALFDPYDQSLWFYHQNLMSTFDPSKSHKSMAPNLSDMERLEYVATEQTFIEELLEDAEDSKWVYQALIECALLKGKLTGSLPAGAKNDIRTWLDNLKKLDPLRNGRWNDTERALFYEYA